MNKSGKNSGQDPGNVRARVHITGLVQGVGYRANAERQAARRGLTGWVVNRPDGSVEAVLEGPHPVVEDMIQWCRRGPSFARVDGVEVAWEAPTGEFTHFGVRL